MTEVPDASRPTISVRGEAHLEVEPELARLSVQVQSRDTDRAAALDQLARRNRECLDLIASYGEAVQRHETGGLTVAPVLRGRRREGGIRHYQGTVWIRLEVTDFSALGELVTRLADQELTTVTGPAWELRRDSEVYRRAARQAARAAVERARGYAEALGCRLTGLVELTDEGLGTGPPAPMMARALMVADSGPGEEEPPPIDLRPETQNVDAAVVARFTATPPDLG